MSGTDDERFAEIVAGFGDEPDQPVPPWPVSEDVSNENPLAAAAAVEPAAPPPLHEDLPSWLEPDALEEDLDEVTHFEPPPPPKVGRLRPRTALALGLLLLGLGVLFAPYQVGVDDSTGWILIGLALTTGGAAMLISGMRDAPPTDSGPDNGAVV
jgi:hypothetical protein